MSKKHTYHIATTWTGNLGKGTSSYTAYLRNFTVSAEGKPDLHGSADPAFRGDAGRWNPEEMLLAAVSACHKLWYLHLCADAGICVTAYTDHAEAVMDEGGNGSAGRFVSAVLKPRVTIVTAVSAAAFNSAVDCVRAGGRVVAIGLPPEPSFTDCHIFALTITMHIWKFII